MKPAAIPSDKKFLDNALEKSMNELNDFFDINWIRNVPKIVIAKDRNELEKIMGFKTEDWMVGFTIRNGVVLLSKENYEKDSCHKYSDIAYVRLLKHELVHLFLRIYIENGYCPKWLDEGVAVYLSGQNTGKKKPKSFKKFLDYYDKNGKAVYGEGGFVVEVLIKKIEKGRFLDLIKGMRGLKSKREFDEWFEEVCGFGVGEINKMMNAK